MTTNNDQTPLTFHLVHANNDFPSQTMALLPGSPGRVSIDGKPPHGYWRPSISRNNVIVIAWHYTGEDPPNGRLRESIFVQIPGTNSFRTTKGGRESSYNTFLIPQCTAAHTDDTDRSNLSG